MGPPRYFIPRVLSRPNFFWAPRGTDQPFCWAGRLCNLPAAFSSPSSLSPLFFFHPPLSSSLNPTFSSRVLRCRLH
ncbi:hypothetical protein LMH87_003805 [Akanthomyces muscarius]|uniref:Uncharacterized protein n=1 Tax=Akanthomyces muscarius TaxID=2231603 RepID=A0A9W8Q243_AKAMU|nr:hypothetical protein LMH87_003805 [Akanthomyces muscarius]KAJ4144938.1 hypothetical protein LMH87_003805 [Akanthomyces muscarius]